MVYKVNKLGHKWTLNGVAFSCSNAKVNHNELKIMFGFLVPSYSPDTFIKLHGVTTQQGKHFTAVRSSDVNHKQTTPSDLFTDTLTIKLLTHSTIRQRHNNPITGLDRPWWF